MENHASSYYLLTFFADFKSGPNKKGWNVKNVDHLDTGGRRGGCERVWPRASE